MAIILSSSLSRLLHLDRISRAGGYIHPDSAEDDAEGTYRGSFINAIGGRGRPRHAGGNHQHNVEDENRLIDQLDEELG